MFEIFMLSAFILHPLSFIISGLASSGNVAQGHISGWISILRHSDATQ
jgi:hypothetical protein